MLHFSQPQNGGTLGRMLDRDRSTALQAEKSRENPAEAGHRDALADAQVHPHVLHARQRCDRAFDLIDRHQRTSAVVNGDNISLFRGRIQAKV